MDVTSGSEKGRQCWRALRGSTLLIAKRSLWKKRPSHLSMTSVNSFPDKFMMSSLQPFLLRAEHVANHMQGQTRITLLCEYHVVGQVRYTERQEAGFKSKCIRTNWRNKWKLLCLRLCQIHSLTTSPKDRTLLTNEGWQWLCASFIYSLCSRTWNWLISKTYC